MFKYLKNINRGFFNLPQTDELIYNCCLYRTAATSVVKMLLKRHFVMEMTTVLKFSIFFNVYIFFLIF